MKTIKDIGLFYAKYVQIAIASFVLFYLMLGVGLHGDDYSSISTIQNGGLKEFITLNSDKFQIFGVLNYYSIWWAYYVFGYEFQFMYDVIKAVVHILAIYLVFIFFKDYLSKDRAILASIIFIMYPLHDTTTYWYMTLFYVTTPALILFAHSLVRNDRIKLAIPILALGSIWHYSSPAYVFGLTVVFLFEKEFRKAAIFAIPGFIYLLYYFWIKFNYIGIERRINADLSTLDFLKQMLIQPLSFLESAIGPSYWLKVFYAIESISFASIIIVVIISIIVFNKVDFFTKASQLPKSLFFGLIGVLILSFGMFALTGLYSHSAFNLGNRTTVYGSLLIAFLLAALLPANKKSVVFLLIVFLAPVFGLSDHWKSWNANQKIVIENIRNNQDLKEIEHDSTLILTGNIYSKLGPYAHIEFFSMPWNINAIFQDSVRTKNIVALTPYVVINDDYLVDPKFGGKYSLKNKLYIYESEGDLVREVLAKDVPELIKKQPIIVRHWTQLFKDTWVQNTIVWLSPRLVYLFE